MRSAATSIVIVSVALLTFTFALAADQSKADKERQEIRKRTGEILAQLYKAEPKAKANVQKAAGYAVFSNFGMKIFVAGSGTGKASPSTTRARRKRS
jgi:uncharacterized membrane protein